MGAGPIVTEDMSTRQRGHFKIANGAVATSVAAAPQCWQNLLPMNIRPKQDAQAIVANFDSQY